MSANQNVLKRHPSGRETCPKTLPGRIRPRIIQPRPPLGHGFSGVPKEWGKYPFASTGDGMTQERPVYSSGSGQEPPCLAW
jgi:hypothetical protein